MTRTRFVSKLLVALSSPMLAAAVHAQGPQPSNMIPETGKPPAVTAWNHAELMRLYSWVIINDSEHECNRVLDVLERSDGGVLATCSAYEQTGKAQKILRYRVDQLPLKPGFAEHWFRVTPVRMANVPDAPAIKRRR